MTKTEALELLGGTVTQAAEAIGISTQAVSLWPEELPPRIADRVQAALWRRAQNAGSTPPAAVNPTEAAPSPDIDDQVSEPSPMAMLGYAREQQIPVEHDRRRADERDGPCAAREPRGARYGE